MDSAWRSGGPAVVVQRVPGTDAGESGRLTRVFVGDKIVSKFEGHVDVLTVGKMTTGREIE